MFSGVTRQCLAAFAGTLAMLMVSTSYGWPSAVIQRLNDPGNEFHLTLAQSSLMVSIIGFGEISSPILSGYLANKVGRKYMLLIAAPLYIISWLLVATVKHVFALYAMRVLQGVGVGIVCTVEPLYLSEIAAPQMRGLIGTLSHVMWSLGIMFEFCVGPYVGFYDLIYINNVLPILFIASFLWMPESPYYLLLKHEDPKAEQTLKWLRAKEDVESELNEIAKTLMNEESEKRKSSFQELLTNKVFFKFLIIILTLTVVKYMSGCSAILSFASIAFVSDKDSPVSADQFAILVGGINVVCSVLTGCIVDRLGRRPLLLLSTTGCTVSLGSTAVLYFLINVIHLRSDSFVWLIFTTISLYFICFSFGLGPLLPLIRSELFPFSVSGLVSGITEIIDSATVFLNSSLYQLIADTIGMYVNFIIGTIFCFFGMILVIIYLPETKGKTFAEIQQETETKANNVSREVSHL